MNQLFLQRVQSWRYALSPVWQRYGGGSIALLLTSFAVAGGVCGLRQLGVWQSLELVAYDQMVRMRPQKGVDSRVLVVAITEADLQTVGRWPLSDQTVATLLQKIQQHRPVAIGLDIYRDLPQIPGTAALAKQLRQPNVISITKLGEGEDELGVPSPPSVPPEQVGFNDLLLDGDGVVRRSLLMADVGDTTYYSFALQLALLYLGDRGIHPEAGHQNSGHLRLKTAEFTPLENDFGAYHTVDAAGYQLLLDYRNRTIAPVVSLGDVMDGKVNPSLIQGKIVLIGTTARSLKDLFFTPYSLSETGMAKMPGVMVHGQIVSNLLSATLDHRPLMRSWTNEWDIVWIVGWSLAGGLIAWSVRHPLLCVVDTTLMVMVLGGVVYGAFLYRVWVPIVAPGAGLLMSAGGIVSYRAQQSQRQQQMMMKLLGQNTSPQIAQALWNSRDRLLKSGKLPGQRLTATMLFTDIKDFSSISERMTPEELLEWLNEYLGALTQEVCSRHGVINKFTGDGILAAFGVPVNRTVPIEIAEDAQRAVDCALAMGDRLRILNQDWGDRGLPVVQMRVGIFTGPIVVGSLGGKERLEYGIIGDSVNIASRLESSYKERHEADDVCRVLIAQETLDYLGDRICVEHWGPMALKGKEQKIDVYRVLGHRADLAPSVSTQDLLDG